MSTFDLEYKLQALLVLVEAAAYLGLAGWALGRGREGRWAQGVGLGAGLVGVVLGLNAVAAFEQVFLHSTHVAEALFLHDHVGTVLTVARTAGVLVLVAGFVESRRSPAGSFHGG